MGLSTMGNGRLFVVFGFFDCLGKYYFYSTVQDLVIFHATGHPAFSLKSRMNMNSSSCENDCNSTANNLNQHCYCKTLNRDLLLELLKDDNLAAEIFVSHPQLFSNTAAFISADQWIKLKQIVDTIERVVHLPHFQQKIATQEIQCNAAGVFVGVDFHISATGPKVIEINTNAGGGFLNAALLAAQTACCEVLNPALPLMEKQLHEEFIAMFRNEWRLCRGDKTLTTIAIVDQHPEQQFLYPEFRIAQAVLKNAGFNVLIIDPSGLQWNGEYLVIQNERIDLIYNRLTDFSLTESNHQHLRQAYDQDAVVITPNPFHHAIYADKRNLILLGDKGFLQTCAVTYEDIQTLEQAIPKTHALTAENADQFWQERKQLFFKPACGFGSKAAYRGDKITTKVWQEILQGNYIAQELVPPGQRGVSVDNKQTELKMDIRAYCYQGKIQLLAARLYQGQTTNFRTDGGGFAPVFVVG
jgi:hypothetical protein